MSKIDIPRPITVEDAKRVQRLVEHLQELRKHRDFLSDKRARASGVNVRIDLSDRELPPELQRAGGNKSNAYVNGRSYSYDSRDGWYVHASLHHGTMNDTQWTRGYLPTIGTRVMDSVRAAVADEIEAAEGAITALGFAVPQ